MTGDRSANGRLGWRPVLLTVVLALALRLGLLGWVWGQGTSLLLKDAWDQQGYHLMAVNLLRHHRFAIANVSADPELRKAAGFIADLPPAQQQNYYDFLDRDRTPGLPVFMAAVYAVAGPNPYAAAVAFCLVSALAAGIAHIATADLLGPRAGAAAGVLMAICPGAILSSSQILSDTLHMALVAAFMLALWRALKHQSAGLAVVAGLCLGAAALVRPITLYVPALLAVVLLLLRVRPAVWVGVLVGAYLAVLPWCARNAVAYGKFRLSDIGTYNMLNYNLPYARARARRVGVSAATQSDSADMSKPEAERRAIIRRDVARYWPFLLRNQMVGALMFWVSADRGCWAQLLTGRVTFSYALERMWDSGPEASAVRILRSPGAVPAMVQAGYNALWALLGLAGAVVCLRRRVARTEVVVALCCCAYYSLLTGPVASGRFRLAVDPFMAMLGGAAVVWLCGWLHKGKQRPVREVA